MTLHSLINKNHSDSISVQHTGYVKKAKFILGSAKTVGDKTVELQDGTVIAFETLIIGLNIGC